MQQKHFISHSWPNRPHTVQNQNYYKGAIMNHRKCKSSHIHVLCDDWCQEFFFFWPKVKEIPVQSTLVLHFLFCWMQSEWQPVRRKPQNVEQNERSLEKESEQKWLSLMFVTSGYKNKAQSPWKNLEGWPSAVFTKKSHSLAPAN